MQRGRQVNGLRVTSFQNINCPIGETTCTRTEYNEDTQRGAIEQLKVQLTQAQNALADLERQASSRSVPRQWRQ
jgi:hypothetical protein